MWLQLRERSFPGRSRNPTRSHGVALAHGCGPFLVLTLPQLYVGRHYPERVPPRAQHCRSEFESARCHALAPRHRASTQRCGCGGSRRPRPRRHCHQAKVHRRRVPPPDHPPAFQMRCRPFPYSDAGCTRVGQRQAWPAATYALQLFRAEREAKRRRLHSGRWQPDCGVSRRAPRPRVGRVHTAPSQLAEPIAALAGGKDSQASPEWLGRSSHRPMAGRSASRAPRRPRARRDAPWPPSALRGDQAKPYAP
mmetsp:Transcript_550/g.1829  ORF Transcript_550/g.1829 Transcript_550/m.1829 type:complete len:251 (+) Transcript_550:2463-3215(+)